MKKLITGIAALILFSFFPVLAIAETATAGVGANVNAAVGGNGASAGVAVSLDATLLRGRDRGDQEIDRRNQNLADAAAHIAAMKNLSETDKASIAATVTNNVNALTALKAKIDADTDAETLKTDLQSITGSYRVYALLMPQLRIIVASDRIVTVAGEMQAFGEKLNARIIAAESAGADMTAAKASLADLAAKISDAQAQAQASVTAVATLQPDEGDTTKMAANIKALQSARATVVAGQKDLIAARADAQAIILAVKGMPLEAKASATASTSAQVGE
jgi:hypothetical protein